MRAWASPAASSLRVSSGMPCRAAIGDTSCCRFRVACLGFLNDRWGNKQGKACPLCVPPLLGNLLVGRGDEVTAWPCGEIADDSRFEVDFWFHGWTLSNLGLGVKIVPHARWAERQASGAGNSRSEARAEAVSRRLQAIVRRVLMLQSTAVHLGKTVRDTSIDEYEQQIKELQMYISSFAVKSANMFRRGCVLLRYVCKDSVTLLRIYPNLLLLRWQR